MLQLQLIFYGQNALRDAIEVYFWYTQILSLNEIVTPSYEYKKKSKEEEKTKYQHVTFKLSPPLEFKARKFWTRSFYKEELGHRFR